MAKKKQSASAEEQGFLQAIREDAKDRTTHLAYADWLEEHGRPYEAMLQRAAAGVSEVRYKIRRKSDGLFAESKGYYSDERCWTETGKEYRKFAHLKSHMQHQGGHSGTYRGLPLSAVEVVAFEIRPQQVSVIPVVAGKNRWNQPIIEFREPLGGEKTN